MTGNDIRQIAIAAVVAAVVTVGVLAARPGTSVGPAPTFARGIPTATVGPLSITSTATLEPSQGLVTATLHVVNPTKSKHKSKFDVFLVRQTFKGSPLQRTAGPRDYQYTDVSKKSIRTAVDADSARDIDVQFDIPKVDAPQPSAAQTPGSSAVIVDSSFGLMNARPGPGSYIVEMRSAGESVQLAFAMPKTLQAEPIMIKAAATK